MGAPFNCLLIANRGEIAIRIARSAAELGITTVGVYPADDAASLHCAKLDRAVEIPGRGVGAYLDGAALIETALREGATAIHPGYGFLSENADFAQACADAGLTFVGPSPQTLALFGDKAAARALAVEHDVPVLEGSAEAGIKDLFAKTGAVMIKAVAGGGGRGMRRVTGEAGLDHAMAAAKAEAKAAFGSDAIYAEQLVTRARHIEVQILGDGGDALSAGERDCTIQRRHQKLVEIAPAPGLDPALRDAMEQAALTLARATSYTGVGTFEFLADLDRPGAFYFIEANPRLQVEHTITEEVTGLDLVACQIGLAGGASLGDLGLHAPLATNGTAIQLRINLEGRGEDGSPKPASGPITSYAPPSGPGLRVDDAGYAGFSVSPHYDSLIAKLIVHHRDFASATARAYRGLCEFALVGPDSTIPLLQDIVRDPAFAAWSVTTGWLDQHQPARGDHPKRHPAAVSAAQDTKAQSLDVPAGQVVLAAPSTGVVVELLIEEGGAVAQGAPIAMLEAMKMQSLIHADEAGYVRTLLARPGDTVHEGQPLALIEPAAIEADWDSGDERPDPDHIRPDLAEVLDRHAAIMDDARPEAVAKRRKLGKRMARENLGDLLDEGSFIEYGAMALAAQRRRRTLDDLKKMSPADGLIGGVGTVNAARFGEDAARVMAISYDYTVFAGTQGAMNHKKTDRLLKLAEDWAVPLVLFAEGGGGRPGDSDTMGVAGLDVPTFASFARLSGNQPLVGVVSGRCFAGNAALLGCCDVIIATEDTTLGMAGPAMIEGGGLGQFKPEDVGPVSVQAPNGVIDIVVDDEADAVAAAKTYLGYFQGALAPGEAADPRNLRHLVPEDRKRIYDIRTVIDTLADTGSVLELRRAFAPGMITALIRIEGKPFGLMANNPGHLGGAIDAPGADKAARFLQLCDAFGLPVLSLCDTPGFMVGPEAEKQAGVRHMSRMFVTAAKLRVPVFTLVLRKGYGLGAQAMAAGSFHAPFFIASWPSGEFGGMGLEGAVRLGFSKELAAEPTEEARQALFEKLVAASYEHGKALNMAAFLEIDAVIDPAETRRWVLRGLAATGPLKPGKGRGFIDTW
mgnify:CR=1 FL=1